MLGRRERPDDRGPFMPIISQGPGSRPVFGAARCTADYFELGGSSAASVGPGALGGNRLGPDRRKTFFGSVLASIIRPMKQLLISSQFCSPQRISLLGSGLNGLLGELSKWEIAITR